ncbi:MAG TPA: sulfotransferase [Gemmatimonadota bacterium]|nr:sulfotransferase [Gemmatimonadota bacterium]
MSEAPIFIVGAPRSGTGLLRDLLRSHPRLTFTPEAQFIPRFFRAYGDPRDEREARRLAARILRSRHVRRWNLSIEPSEFSHLRSFREVVGRVFEEWARRENKPRWGEKTPQYVLEIPTLLKIFPDARILHVYRDGRDVALSSMATWFGPYNLFQAANAWKRYVTSGRRVGRALPGEVYLEVRYEALLDDPPGVLTRVCSFIGEPFDDSVLRPNRIPPAFRYNRGQGSGWAAETEIVAGNQGGWKRRMSLADRALFESLAGDLLEDLGYEREGMVRRISRWERYLWQAHNRCRWFQVRLEAWPVVARRTKA